MCSNRKSRPGAPPSLASPSASTAAPSPATWSWPTPCTTTISSLGPISDLAALSIVSTAAPWCLVPSAALQSVSLSVLVLEKTDDRFSGSTFVWFPARRFSPFLSPSLFSRRRSFQRQRLGVWFPARRMSPFLSPSLFSRRRSLQRQRLGVLVPSASMRPFLSLSCSREDDRLAGKRLVRVLIAPEENAITFSPSFSLGSRRSRGHPPRYATTPPSAQKRGDLARGLCLRKGCGRKYQPRRWNQRYCQDPECLREVRRWQAARRQAKRRQDAASRARHAQAEKAAPPASQSRAQGR